MGLISKGWPDSFAKVLCRRPRHEQAGKNKRWRKRGRGRRRSTDLRPTTITHPMLLFELEATL